MSQLVSRFTSMPELIAMLQEKLLKGLLENIILKDLQFTTVSSYKDPFWFIPEFCVNFFRHLWLTTSLKKEWKRNKIVFYNYCIFKEILKRDAFHPGMKYLYEKYCLSYVGIPPSQEEMKNVLVSYRCNENFMKKWL